MWKLLKKLPKAWCQHKVCTPLSIGPSHDDDKTVSSKYEEKPTKKHFYLLRCKRSLQKSVKSESTVASSNNLIKTSAKQFELQTPINYGASYNKNESIRLPFTFEALGLGFIFFLGLKHGSFNCRRYRDEQEENKKHCPGLSNFLFSIVLAVRNNLPRQVPSSIALQLQNVVKQDSGDEVKPSKSTISPENDIPSASHIRASMIDLAQKYTSLILNAEAEMCLKNADFPKAVQYFRQAGDMGLDIALYSLGVCYETGTGVQKNNEQAFRYYMEAGNKGNSAAMYNCAVCYMDGTGVAANEEECLKYMLKASDGGIKEAQTFMGIHYGKRDEFDKAAVLFQKAVDQKDSDAEYFLGLCYEHGLGVDCNITKAVELFDRAATSGNTEACYRLANYYEQGLGGLAEDPEKAERLLRKAADGGHVLAVEKLKYDQILANDVSKAKQDIKMSNSSPELNPSNQEQSVLSKSSSITSLFELSFLHDILEGIKIGRKEICLPKFYLEVEDENTSVEMKNCDLTPVG